MTEVASPALVESDQITREELQLATRNHGMPLEALRYPLTPIGLHYLLIHYDIPCVDPAAFRLTVDGDVARRLSLTLDEIRHRPSRAVTVTMECAGNGRARLQPRPLSQPWLMEAVGTAEWTGVPLASVLEEAGVHDGARDVVFRGLDHGIEGGEEQDYARSLPLPEARRDEVLLAYEINGQPLPPQHGFPLRLVVPGWYGMTNVKWLTGITVTSVAFTGYQQSRGYRFRSDPDDPGEPVTRMRPRSLMVPPGFPDFLTRHRIVPRGRHVIEGKAWSGTAPIARVDVSTDGGRSWVAARLGPPSAAPWAWRHWSLDWDASVPGDYDLCCRATDETGEAQPDEPPWNLGGYVNNSVHRVPVTVRPS